jgi:hypothetical protein
MMFKKLVKTEELEFEGRRYTVRYFEAKTLRGTQRYSSELVLAPADRIILDAGSLTDLESRVARFVPATLYSRMLAAKAPAA